MEPNYIGLAILFVSKFKLSFFGGGGMHDEKARKEKNVAIHALKENLDTVTPQNDWELETVESKIRWALEWLDSISMG